MQDNCIALSELMLTAPPAGRPVAYYNEQYLLFGQFQAAVNYWADRFQTEPFGRYALFTGEAYPFTVLMFALLHSGKEVWIPGNNCAGTAQQLQEEGCRLIGDWHFERLLDFELFASGRHGALKPLNPAETRLVIFTSGSSGEPKPIKKSLFQLQREVFALETLWGGRLAKAQVLSTVSHQHIYGLLFRVLWPLSAGRCFHSSIYLNPEILVNNLNDSPACWIASPAHLKRLDQDSPWQALSGLNSIFSSGGDLPETAARQIEKHCGKPVLEIYGSSETGGIAWREHDRSWTLFPGMKLTAHGERWRLSSPYLADESGYTLDDKISLCDDRRFQLQGRADRVVKIEEKRLSLTALEQRFLDLPLIKEAYICTAGKSREVVAAVVAMSDEGKNLLKAQGRAALIKRMRAFLRDWFEPVLLPKKWLIVDKIPLTAQSKTDRIMLTALLDFDNRKFPQVLSLEQSLDNIQLEIKVPQVHELVYFPDHFAGYPILPGVIQLAWVEHFGKILFPIEESLNVFSHLEVIKFIKVIRPGEELTLTLNWSAAGELAFSFSSHGGACSSGRMAYKTSQAA